MKRIITTALVAFVAVVAMAQKNPVGMRMEVAEVEQNNKEYSVFTYKDEDGTFGYYLSLGKVYRLMSLIRDPDAVNTSFDHIVETCIWLGATSDEAYATLGSILDLFDQDEETITEFSGRASTGGERLGAPNTSTCVVQKKPLGGKRLQFLFSTKTHTAETFISKSAVKQLRWSFKLDRKLHPKSHQANSND